jgi:hypothetical protein
VALTETALATTCTVLLRDWTLLLTGIGRVGLLAFVSRWALAGQRWGRVALAIWFGSQMVLSALGAALAAFAPDLLLQWVPHNPVVRSIPPHYWAFPASRLAVFLMVGAVVFGSSDVAAFWEEQRGRRVASLSPLAWLYLVAAVLAFVIWRVAVTDLAEPGAASVHPRN